LTRASAVAAGLLFFAAAGRAENWPAWRGPRGDGTSLETGIPLHWNATSNVLWTIPVPGVGHASPIVWSNRLFTVTAIPETEARALLCVDCDDGKVLWQKEVLKAPFERKHALNSFASSTPATDGERVYVAFLDRTEMAVAAFDFDGRPRWLARPGPFASMHGFCSSPILYRDMVIVNGDHDGDSYLVALDRVTGKTVWKTPRQNRTRSYCAPIIRELDGRTQMVLTGDKCVASYDPNNGRLHWIIDGPTEQFVASPVYSGRTGLIYITGGYPDHHILSIRPNGRGNVTRTHIVWRTTRGAAYVPSPILEGDYFLVVSDSGVAHCFDAATGDLYWAERLGEHHASLLSAGGSVYFLNDDGVTHVVKPDRTYQLVARNELAERTFASPAISEGRLFVRGDRHLFCIGRAR
jgi:outer membrane protein assembly factor BamB